VVIKECAQQGADKAGSAAGGVQQRGGAGTNYTLPFRSQTNLL